MTVSNEPGYYKDGKYGIRLENVVLIREAKTPNNFGDKGYLGFEHVTMYDPVQLPRFFFSLLKMNFGCCVGRLFIRSLWISRC